LLDRDTIAMYGEKVKIQYQLLLSLSNQVGAGRLVAAGKVALIAQGAGAP
jgi:hypothetical protein